MPDDPRQLEATQLLNSTGTRVSLVVGGQSLDIDRIRVVWLRRPHPPPATGSATTTARVVRGWLQILSLLWYELRDRFWINPYPNDRAGHCKPYQLSVARYVGLDVPHTVITNVPADAARLVAESPNGVVYKTLERVSTVDDLTGNYLAIPTSVVDPAMLLEHPAAIAVGACTFQERLAKEFDVRVTAMGSRIYGVSIRGEQSVRHVDWRTHIHTVTYDVFHLDELTVLRIRSLLDSMGLVFGCVDFVKTVDGRLVFLEINPSGQWLWLNRFADPSLLESFGDFVEGHDR